jgi:hypothetical protein
LSAEEIRDAARRAGAPVELPPGDAAAAELLRELNRGRGPRESLQRLLRNALGQPSSDRTVTDNARAAAAWIAATPTERGAALEDLLLLADALPHRRQEPLSFPDLRSAAA